ncbi:hypothetical protein [Ammonifex thiophilus]|uniref:Uncharacterized protein n=1 Tax=Ammonifex thiophilus TaxID=444093 RepID=A0A3D8P3J3_9THEO|nr:hypothetical protein [Ammonifex thiophilus]RDV83428.1 hypothetical protein DXX99_05415 [Ammonifex thiophilus]
MKKALVLAIALWSLSFAFFDWSWMRQVLDRDMEAISGSVDVRVVVNGHAEEAFQELQPIGPNLFGAEAKVEKVVDGVSARASSFVQIYLPTATVK